METMQPGVGKTPVDGGEIAFRVAGDGTPLAATHPYVMPRAGYAPLPGFTTITVWPRGFGESTPARDESDYGFWRLADDLDAVRRHLGLERWVFWGVSMGGFTGLIYALAYQDTLSALILDSTAASYHYRHDPDSIWPRLRERPEAQAFYDEPSMATLRPFFTRIWELMGMDNPNAVMEEWLAASEFNPYALGQIIRTIERFDTRDRLGEIHIPTLILAGERDPQCPPGQARLLAAGIPGAVLNVYPLAGHGVIRHNPPGVLADVQDFVAQALARSR